MNRLDSLNEQRASVKLRYEAAWRVGDCEAEAMALCELEQIDREMRHELARIEMKDEQYPNLTGGVE